MRYFTKFKIGLSLLAVISLVLVSCDRKSFKLDSETADRTSLVSPSECYRIIGGDEGIDGVNDSTLQFSTRCNTGINYDLSSEIAFSNFWIIYSGDSQMFALIFYPDGIYNIRKIMQGGFKLSNGLAVNYADYSAGRWKVSGEKGSVLIFPSENSSCTDYKLSGKIIETDISVFKRRTETDEQRELRIAQATKEVDEDLYVRDIHFTNPDFIGGVIGKTGALREIRMTRTDLWLEERHTLSTDLKGKIVHEERGEIDFTGCISDDYKSFDEKLP